jgi:hypothetical protein
LLLNTIWTAHSCWGTGRFPYSLSRRVWDSLTPAGPSMGLSVLTQTSRNCSKIYCRFGCENEQTLEWEMLVSLGRCWANGRLDLNLDGVQEPCLWVWVYKQSKLIQFRRTMGKSRRN